MNTQPDQIPDHIKPVIELKSALIGTVALLLEGRPFIKCHLYDNIICVSIPTNYYTESEV